MARIIAVVNQKGGVGKTTTTVNLGASLASLGQSVLVLDVDPQANASSGLGWGKDRVEASVYDALIGGRSLASLVVATEVPNLKLLPSSPALAGAEVELVPIPERERVLTTLLEPLRSKFNVILIDCPPSLGLITLNALVACDTVIVPIQCEYYALEGLGHLLNTLSLVRESLNPALEIEGIVLTMYDRRTNLCHQVAHEIRTHFKDLAFQTVIPRNVTLSECPSHGQPVLLYDNASRGSRSYMSLAREFCERNRRFHSAA